VNESPHQCFSFDDVIDVLRIIEASGTPSVVEFRKHGVRLRVELGGGTDAAPQATASREPVSRSIGTASAIPAAATPRAAEGEYTRPGDEADGLVVPAPITGVFYRAPSPGAKPFIEVGDEVTEETVIGIIEVMKLMSHVRAGVAGVVTEIGAENGALVEMGQVLVRLKSAPNSAGGASGAGAH
jgi:acetyl-CoA carboxylase biotin carboxyl carrier protein